MSLITETGKSYFYQWDTNQVLIVEGEPNCREVHFGYRDGSFARVCQIREEDGRRVVDIPNELLQEDRTFFVYPINDEEDDAPMRSQSFVVLLRPKPDDYVHTEPEIQTYEALEERITALEENGGTGGTIKTVNGVTPDENGNVEIEIGGNTGDWKHIRTVVLSEDVQCVSITADENGYPFEFDEIAIRSFAMEGDDGKNATTGAIWVNDTGFTDHTAKNSIYAGFNARHGPGYFSPVIAHLHPFCGHFAFHCWYHESGVAKDTFVAGGYTKYDDVFKSNDTLEFNAKGPTNKFDYATVNGQNLVHSSVEATKITAFSYGAPYTDHLLAAGSIFEFYGR